MHVFFCVSPVFLLLLCLLLLLLLLYHIHSLSDPNLCVFFLVSHVFLYSNKNYNNNSNYNCNNKKCACVAHNLKKTIVSLQQTVQLPLATI